MTQGEFLNETLLTTEFGQVIDIRKGNIFWNLLNDLEDWGYVPGPFQFSNLFQLLDNQLCQVSSVSFF